MLGEATCPAGMSLRIVTTDGSLIVTRSEHRPTVSRWLWATTMALVALSPLVPDAQPARRTHRIGLLETTSPEHNAANVQALRDGLRDFGYVEGQNLAIVYRAANGHPERFEGLARELVGLKVDLIVTRGTPAA